MPDNSSQKVVRTVLLGAGRPYKGSNHSGLVSTVGGTIILDWILGSFRGVSTEIEFVGGYELASIKAKYPKLKYCENSNWENTKAAASFFTLDLKEACDYLVSYVDIVYRDDVVRKLIEKNYDVVVTVDTSWLVCL